MVPAIIINHSFDIVLTHPKIEVAHLALCSVESPMIVGWTPWSFLTLCELEKGP